jgi:hypothetical protein
MSRRKPATATATAPIDAPVLAPGEIWAATMPAAALARVLAAVLPATAPGRPDPGRLWPSCVALVVAGDDLRAIATDGHLLAVAAARGRGASATATATPTTVLAPAAEVKRLIAALRDAGRRCLACRISATADYVEIDAPGARVRAIRADDDGWPAQYAQVVPARRATDDPTEQPGATYWSAPILARVAECLAGYGATASDPARIALPDDPYGPLRADLGVLGDGLTVVAMPMRAPGRDHKPITGAA